MAIRSRLRPDVPLIPARLSIQAENPDGGCWDWNITLTERCLDGNVLIEKENPVIFKDTIGCSAVYDPVPGIHSFVRSLCGASDSNWMMVDEEPTEYLIEYWKINSCYIHMCFSRDMEDVGSDEDAYQKHFLIERKNAYEEFHREYCSFGANGGWGSYYSDDLLDCTKVPELDFSSVKIA